MISQERHFQNSTQADYASVRSKVEKQNKGFELEDDQVSISSSTGNQNLSSVLSQIQDDGPARSESGKTDNLYKFKTKQNNPYAEDQQRQSASGNNYQADPTAELQQINHGVEQNINDDSNNSAWVHTFLLILVISAVVFYQVKLDFRTNQLEQSINSHQENIQNTISTYGNVLSPDINNMNQTLIDVKNALAIINPNAIDLAKDSFYSQTNVVTESILEVDKINLLEDEITLLKSELEITKRKLVLDDDGLSSKSEAIPSIGINAVNNSVWAVNLASFEDRARAEAAAKKVLPSGFEPLIEVASVNGVKKYRLIVSGFIEHDEAVVFVSLAADLYGFDGGWIRKINSN